MLFIEFSEKQYACRDCYVEMQRSYLCVVEFTLVKSCSTVMHVTKKSSMYIGYMMLHHRIQTDLKGVDAGVQASTPCTSGSTPCTSGSTKNCADCRALCEYDRMQEVACCSRLHVRRLQPVMQASCQAACMLQACLRCMSSVALALRALHEHATNISRACWRVHLNGYRIQPYPYFIFHFVIQCAEEDQRYCKAL